MPVHPNQIAAEFAISEEELIRRALRAFLLDQLHLMDAERRSRCAKFGVNSLEELDQLIIENPDKESEMLEDFQQVDYLTDRIDQISQLIQELS